MGCGASRDVTVVTTHDPAYIQVTDAWDRAWKTVDFKKGRHKTRAKNLVVRRTGWKTIRVFVSSTFKDFHQEREVLVKKVSLF